MSGLDIIHTWYGGSVSENRTGSFQVAFETGGEVTRRTFSLTSYSSSEETRAAAEEYRKTTAIERGCVEIAYKHNHPVEARKFIAGFLDGDGSISMDQRGSYRVDFTQAGNTLPTILSYIKNFTAAVSGYELISKIHSVTVIC